MIFHSFLYVYQRLKDSSFRIIISGGYTFKFAFKGFFKDVRHIVSEIWNGPSRYPRAGSMDIYFGPFSMWYSEIFSIWGIRLMGFYIYIYISIVIHLCLACGC